MDIIEIGAVAKPQGIKGELKIRLFCDDFESVKDVRTAFIDGVPRKIEYFRPLSGEEAVMKIDGVSDRNVAELLRRKEVFAYKSEIKVPEGKHFIADIIGCALYLSSGKEIGEIYDIVKGNVDYYYIKTSEGNAVFPKIPELKAVTDVENRRVTVDAKKFTETVMYED
ncbi:MAG TPA: 16S rRNA processing protein RimM [Clostridiales bacterium]|nr:16S rRNA processing protein RimM [Clostridiales bacterium]